MKKNFSLKVMTLAAGILSGAPLAGAHSPSEHARVYFIGLEDGAVVTCPFTLKLGIEGYGIVPAGTKDKRRHTGGHHHVLVDVDGLPDMDAPIPRNAHYIHLDHGETTVVIDLPPGDHTLQLLLGDEEHEPLDPPLLSKKIHIRVKE